LRGVIWRFVVCLVISMAVVLAARDPGGLSRAEAQGVHNPIQVVMGVAVECGDQVTWTVVLSATNIDSYPARITGSVTYNGQAYEPVFSPNPLPPGASGRARVAVPAFGQGSFTSTATPEGPGLPANLGAQGGRGPLNFGGCAMPRPPTTTAPSPPPTTLPIVPAPPAGPGPTAASPSSGGGAGPLTVPGAAPVTGPDGVALPTEPPPSEPAGTSTVPAAAGGATGEEASAVLAAAGSEDPVPSGFSTWLIVAAGAVAVLAAGGRGVGGGERP
jgi:hypothetical protein